MDRYSIEKRDRELVERFRAKVELKEQQKRRNRIRMAAVFLVLVCAGMVFFYRSTPAPDSAADLSPDQDAQMHKSRAVAVSRVTAQAPSEQRFAPPAAVYSESSEASEDSVRTAAAESAEIDVSAGAPAAPVSASAPEKTVKPAASEKAAKPDQAIVAKNLKTPADLPVFEPSASLSDKDGLLQKPAPVAPEGGIRIAEITVCQDVRNKQPVTRKTEFSLTQGAKPYVWMDVRSEKPPFQLRHVYYLNGRRYCVVPLDIRYPRMRTWSTVSLEYPTQTGKWRVDVETREGEVLSQVAFSVVP